MRKQDLFFLPAFEIAGLINRQELSASEVLERFIERLQKINPILNAYCTSTLEMARNQAAQVDAAIKRGQSLGRLAGVPTSIKDVLLIKGVRSTFGSKIYENYVPDVDSVAVERLKKAGCVILGKTNSPEFGHKGVTDNLIFGTTKNPWDLTKTSGGSSGGAAAAVASGISPLAVGTDGGGSIRIPSSFCGCYGLKPNYGRISRYPITGISWETLSHYGPIVRYVEDAALMLDSMKGPHFEDYFCMPAQEIDYFNGLNEVPKKLRVGYSMSLGFTKIVDPEVREAVLNNVQKFERIGWEVEEATIKIKNPELAYSVLITTGLAYDLKSKLEKWRDQMSPTLVKYVEAGLKWTAMDLKDALFQRKKMYEVLMRTFQTYDVLITPTTAIPAFDHHLMNPAKIDNKAASPLTWVSFTYPLNMTGLPAASIPCGWTKTGLPIGMQIIGPRYNELIVLQASKAYQDIAPWQEKIPNLA